MTLAISVITKDYALLAPDGRLTWGAGPRRGEVADDDTCELVSLCNTFGIGYSDGMRRLVCNGMRYAPNVARFFPLSRDWLRAIVQAQ